MYYGEPTEEQVHKAGLAAAGEEPAVEEEPATNEEESATDEDAGDETEDTGGEGEGGNGGAMMAWENEGGLTADVPEEKAVDVSEDESSEERSHLETKKEIQE